MWVIDVQYEWYAIITVNIIIVELLCILFYARFVWTSLSNIRWWYDNYIQIKLLANCSEYILKEER